MCMKMFLSDGKLISYNYVVLVLDQAGNWNFKFIVSVYFIFCTFVSKLVSAIYQKAK